MGGANTQPEQYQTSEMMQKIQPKMYPMLIEGTEEILDPSQQEADSYALLEKRGMSDDIDQEVIGAVKDLGKMAKKNLIDPAVSAGKDAAKKLFGGTAEEMVAAKMQPMLIESTEEILDPMIATKIKGMISPSGIQQNTSIDKIRYDRNATGSEFKGVKAKPSKSIINMTAEEAMRDLDL
jgi:hypothetical protein